MSWSTPAVMATRAESLALMAKPLKLYARAEKNNHKPHGVTFKFNFINLILRRAHKPSQVSVIMCGGLALHVAVVRPNVPATQPKPVAVPPNQIVRVLMCPTQCTRMVQVNV